MIATQMTTADASGITRALGIISMEELGGFDPHVAMPTGRVATDLLVAFTEFQATRDIDLLKEMLRTVNNASAYGPHASHHGIMAFHNFEKSLSWNSAKHVKRELKALVSDMPDMRVEQIQGVHETLRHYGWGDRLPPGDLAFFLEFFLDHEPAIRGEGMKLQVDRALMALKRHNKYRHAKLNTGKLFDEDNFFGKVIDKQMEAVRICFEESKKLAEQQDEVPKQDSTRILVGKLVKATAIENLQRYETQLQMLEKVKGAIEWYAPWESI